MLSLDSHNYLNVKRFLMWREKKMTILKYSKIVFTC